MKNTECWFAKYGASTVQRFKRNKTILHTQVQCRNAYASYTAEIHGVHL